MDFRQFKLCVIPLLLPLFWYNVGECNGKPHHPQPNIEVIKLLYLYNKNMLVIYKIFIDKKVIKGKSYQLRFLMARSAKKVINFKIDNQPR